VPQSGDRVQLYFKNFPLEQSCNPSLQSSVHPGSCVLALGSICAHRQGKFWAYHDKVFSEPLQSVQAADVVRIAGEAGLNAAAMEACLADPQAKAQLAADIAEGSRIKISATPTVFVNGKRLTRINDFVQVVEKEAIKKGFPPLPKPQPPAKR
jgi:protein-disulfide isomerase